MHDATFFIATPRSGTQWLARNLSAHYEGELVAAHEPIGYAYRPKAYLRAEDRLDELRASPPVRKHLDRIHRIIRDQPYVEVGFPAFAMAPLLISEFGEHLRLVHLVRNPVRVAASLVTHRWYQGTRDDTLADDVELVPDDPGVAQKNYLRRWPAMRPFERCLFYWTEVHLYGYEVERRYPSVPFHRTRFEDLIRTPDALEELSSFMRIPLRPGLVRAKEKRVDQYRLQTALPIEPSAIWRHKNTLDLANRCGYRITRKDLRGIRQRYRVSSASLLQRIRRRLHKLAAHVRSTLLPANANHAIAFVCASDMLLPFQ